MGLPGLLLVLMGCDSGLVTQAAPRTGPRQTGHSLHIQVTVDAADDSLAEVLGWREGVPGARVMVLANGTAVWDTLETDALGRVTVPVAPVLYRVYAERLLTLEERTLVGAARAFGDGVGVRPSGETALPLRLYADHPGSLVISEIGWGSPPPWETAGGSYLGGLYFEVYNNGEATLHLDGMLFGVGHLYRFTSPLPCPMTESVRRDSLGVYSVVMIAFPGTGMDHRIGPGEGRLVAAQAIDHRPVHPLLLDLSHADFEIADGAAADNPDVPNMRDVGLYPFSQTDLLGSSVYFLATPQDPRELPVSFRDAGGVGYVRIPRETLTDVIALSHLWPERNAENEPCQPRISPVFDRYEGGFIEIGFDTDTHAQAVLGYQRRALRRTPDGRVILVNTNTSAVDFEIALKTPGWVPQPEQ